MESSKREGEYTSNDGVEEVDHSEEPAGEYTDSEIPGETVPDDK